MKNVHLLFLVLFIFSTPLFSQNNCLNLDGSDDYVSCGTFNLTNTSVTFECWFKIDAFQTNSPYISNLMGIEESGNLFMMRIENKKLNVVFYEAGYGYENFFTEPLTTGVWYHAAVSYNNVGTRSVYCYLNGVDFGHNVGMATYFTASGPFYISQLSGNRGLNGQIDEVRIWDVARTQTQIRDNMYNELVGNETSLKAYYKLNESSGTTANDAQSSSNYDGTLYGMAGTEWAPSSAFYGSKGAMYFGYDDYVTINSSYGMGTNSVSAECWVYLTTTSEKGCFVHIGDNDIGYGIGVGNTGVSWDATGNELQILYDQKRWIYTGVNIGTGWHHVAFTIDGVGACTAFLDGIVVYSETGTQTSPIAPANHSSIASSQGLTRVLSNGIIDEVRIWNDIRTEQEIRTNMCIPLIGNEANLVAYYNLNAPSVIDITSNGNNGAITGDNDEHTSSSAFNNWLNTSSTSWSTASNWSTGSVPGTNDNVGIYSHSGASPSISGNPTIRSLIIGSSAGLTMSSDLTVNGFLILNDNLDLNGHDITLGSTATLYENDGLISGTSGTIKTTRNLNNIDENVAGLGAEINTSSNMGSTTIVRGHKISGINGIKRYYHITPTTNPSSATLVLNYDNSELNGQTEADLKLFKSTDGSTWTEQASSTVSTSNHTITLSGISSFSWWTGADASKATVTTQNASDIKITTATGNGNITNLGAPNPTAHGICWGTSADPDINGNKTDEGAATSTGAFTSSVSGLSFATTYHMRAYATNASGTAYGDDISFITEPNQADDLVWGTYSADGMEFTWTNGDGSGRLLIMKEGSAPNDPTDGTTYTANTVFGTAGSQIGTTGTYVVFNGSNSKGTSNVVVTDLNSGSDYHFKVVEYSGSASDINYNITSGSDNYGEDNNGSSGLPVSIISFTADYRSNKTVEILWQTATEITNDFFTVQKSQNGLNWEIVMTIEGAGNSNTILNYSANDNNPYQGVSYYRLKQTDFDGKFSYSQTKSVHIQSSEDGIIDVFPNPVNSQIIIKGSSTELENVSIYNTLGQNVTPLSRKTMNNKTMLIMDLSKLNSGIYYIITKNAFRKIYKQ